MPMPSFLTGIFARLTRLAVKFKRNALNVRFMYKPSLRNKKNAFHVRRAFYFALKDRFNRSYDFAAMIFQHWRENFIEFGGFVLCKQV